MCPAQEGDATQGGVDVSSSGDECGAGGMDCEMARL
jgi:hypothetical protein